MLTCAASAGLARAEFIAVVSPAVKHVGSTDGCKTLDGVERKWLTGPVSFEEVNSLALLGADQVFDLSKHFVKALASNDAFQIRLSIYCPEVAVCKWFVSSVLPFGATGAVVGYNRVARAVH
eukprot:2081602-Amphidinium_carterae.1